MPGCAKELGHARPTNHTHPSPHTPDRASSPNLGWSASNEQCGLAHFHDVKVPRYGPLVDCFLLPTDQSNSWMKRTLSLRPPGTA